MELEKLSELINNSNNIVFFGGAGVSTESNIPDFRSANGIFVESTKATYRPEEIVSHSFFLQHPDGFYEYYKSNLIYKDAKPNLAHIALAKLEQQGKLKAVITQNIDGLHQMAGSKNVIELHGSVHRNYCMRCNKFYSLEDILNMKQMTPTCTTCGGTIKPDVVLYEEQLNMEAIEQAVEYIAKADVLIVGGTSLVVYPAAGMLRYYRGNKLVLINKSTTAYDESADVVIRDSIGKVLDAVVQQITEK